MFSTVKDLYAIQYYVPKAVSCDYHMTSYKPYISHHIIHTYSSNWGLTIQPTQGY